MSGMRPTLLHRRVPRILKRFRCIAREMREHDRRSHCEGCICCGGIFVWDAFILGCAGAGHDCGIKVRGDRLRIYKFETSLKCSMKECDLNLKEVKLGVVARRKSM
jgi:hypothetical protein